MARVIVHHGDCLDVLRTLPSDSIDSCVTDPPYALVSIVKRFGAANAAQAKGDVYARAARGFMGQTWDTGERAFSVELWAEVLRVLKPGAHVMAFGGTRTYHRLACAIEDSGFEIRDQFGWMYGTGFPKSHDVSKAIDKAAGVKREVIHVGATRSSGMTCGAYIGGDGKPETRVTTRPTTPEAVTWQGWGSAVKPAWEPITLARKPLDGTIVQNVLTHGTGALNIDDCRVAGEPWKAMPPKDAGGRSGGVMGAKAKHPGGKPHDAGRWPANIIHDGSDEVMEIFDTFRPGASRFFYSAKANAADRFGSKHPTVKPVDLIAYLCRLITPPGGRVLDMFAGSGTTATACLREGFSAILIEREAEYVNDINRRIAHVGAAK